MLGVSLIKLYEIMREAGLVRSKRDFSRRWLGRGRQFLRDYEQRFDRHMREVSPETVSALRARLCALAPFTSKAVASTIMDIVRVLDKARLVAEALRRS